MDISSQKNNRFGTYPQARTGKNATLLSREPSSHPPPEDTQQYPLG